MPGHPEGAGAVKVVHSRVVLTWDGVAARSWRRVVIMVARVGSSCGEYSPSLGGGGQGQVDRRAGGVACRAA